MIVNVCSWPQLPLLGATSVPLQWRILFLQKFQLPSLPQCTGWISFRRGATTFSIFDSKGSNWLSIPSCFGLSMACLKAGVADYITPEHILERTAVLDIYFSLAWEIQLIPFNQSTSEHSKCRGIWDFAVMNCLLFSDHILAFSRTDENPAHFQKSYLLRIPFWASMGHNPLPFRETLPVPSPFSPYLTNVLQVLDVVSLCAYDLIDDVGPHLVFGGLAHPKAPGILLSAPLHLQGIILHGLILVHPQLQAQGGHCSHCQTALPGQGCMAEHPGLAQVTGGDVHCCKHFPWRARGQAGTVGRAQGSCSHPHMGGFRQAFPVHRSYRNDVESFRNATYKIRTEMVYQLKFS